MKHLFTAFFVIFFVCYFIAEVTIERPPDDGVVRMTWATDPNPARKVQVQAFSELFPGYEIVVDPSTAEKLIIQCSTGHGPDIIDLHSRMIMVQMAQTGVLMDLTEEAKRLGFGLEDTFPSLRDALFYEGKQYRYPCNVGADVVIYNKEIFDKAGVPYPADDWTWDDLIAAAMAINNTEMDDGENYYGFGLRLNLALVFNLLLTLEAQFFSEDGLHCTLDSEEAIRALEFYSDLYFKYEIMMTPQQLLTVSTQGGWGAGASTLVYNEKCAMIMFGRWFTVQFPNYPGLAEKLGAVMIPSLDGHAGRPHLQVRGSGINVNSEHKENAKKFLQYLASPHYSEVIVADGDSIPPNPEFVKTGADLVNANASDPEFQQTFIKAVQHGAVPDESPYFDIGKLMLEGQWLGRLLERIETQTVTPREGLRALTDEVNQEIRKNLERRPDLQRRYEQETGTKYTRDWWEAP